MHSMLVHFNPLGLLWCMQSPVTGLILMFDPVSCTTTILVNSDPGLANFHLPMMVFTFFMNNLVTSLKVRGVEGVVVLVAVVDEDETDILFIMNSLKICHLMPSGRSCNRSKMASLFE